jgi:hypothetical protein
MMKINPFWIMLEGAMTILTVQRPLVFSKPNHQLLASFVLLRYLMALVDTIPFISGSFVHFGLDARHGCLLP